MKKYLLKLLQFGLKIQNKITPANDKLGHFYWGTIYAIGTDLFTDNVLIILIPLLFALSKEWRDNIKTQDGISLGAVEKLDILFTILPGILIYISKFI